VKIINPFYAILMVVGLAFALTACAYTVMSFRNLDPLVESEPGLMTVMEDHGLTILGGELGVLAVLTFAAIGTDDYWTRRHDAREASDQQS
jgi:hypothetical protein